MFGCLMSLMIFYFDACCYPLFLPGKLGGISYAEYSQETETAESRSNRGWMISFEKGEYVEEWCTARSWEIEIFTE